MVKMLPARLVAVGLFLAMFALAVLPDAGERALPMAPVRPPDLDRHGDPLPSGALARLGTQRFRHPGWPWSIGFTAGGRRLVSVGGDGTVIVWDSKTGRPLRTFGEHGFTWGLHGDCAASPDGRTLAIGGGFKSQISSSFFPEPRIVLWNVADGGEGQWLWKQHSGQVSALAYSPDGATLAAVAGGELLLWNVAGARERAKIDLSRTAAASDLTTYVIAFTADSKTLIMGIGYNYISKVDKGPPGPGEIRVLDAERGQEIRRFTVNAKGYLRAMALAPDGQRVAVISEGAAEWDVATGRNLRDLQPQANVHSVAYAPDGQTLALGCYKRGAQECDRGWICIADAATGRERMRIDDDARALTFSPDGAWLAATGDDCLIRLWDAHNGAPLSPADGHTDAVRCLAFAPDGRSLATAADGGTAIVWDLSTGQEQLRRRLQFGYRSYAGFGSVAFAPDGTELATPSTNTAITYIEQPGVVVPATATLAWDVDSGKDRFTLASSARTGGGSICPVVLTPDGRAVAVVDDGVLTLYDLATSRPRLRLPRQAGGIVNIWFAGDGRKLATAGYTAGDDGRLEVPIIRVWDTETGAALQAIPGSYQAPFAFSFDGRVGALGDLAGSIDLWDMVAGKKLRTIKLPAKASALAFATDGLTLASGDVHGRLYLLEVVTGQEIVRRAGHRGAVSAVAFDSARRLVASAGVDTTVLLWDVTDMAPQRPPVPVELSPSEIAQIWHDLASDDSALAERAVGRLARDSAHAVPFLRARLKAVTFLPQPEIDRLVRDLDDDDYEIRHHAGQVLEQQGERAAVTLRKSAAVPTSLEFRRRAEALRRQLEAYVPSVESLRYLRAVAALERIGGREACRLLEELARGAPEARQTREARAALARLGGGSR